MSKLLFKDTLHKEKKPFCSKCTQTFTCKQKLDVHRTWCHGLDNTPQKVTLPVADGKKNFQRFTNHKNMMYAPCDIKLDLESTKKIVNEKYGGKMRKLAEEEANSYSYEVNWINSGET